MGWKSQPIARKRDRTLAITLAAFRSHRMATSRFFGITPDGIAGHDYAENHHTDAGNDADRIYNSHDLFLIPRGFLSDAS